MKRTVKKHVALHCLSPAALFNRILDISLLWIFDINSIVKGLLGAAKTQIRQLAISWRVPCHGQEFSFLYLEASNAAGKGWACCLFLKDRQFLFAIQSKRSCCLPGRPGLPQACLEHQMMWRGNNWCFLQQWLMPVCDLVAAVIWILALCDTHSI